jgi:hypothetical protein
MTVTLPTPVLPRSNASGRPIGASRSPVRPATAAVDQQRERLQAELATLNERIRTAVACGDLDAAAKAILAALDCERRLEGERPQVLQVIKPRR